MFFLKDYKLKHPEVIIVDPPDAIQRLQNRQSMLQDVAELNLFDCNGNLFTIMMKINTLEPKGLGMFT